LKRAVMTHRSALSSQAIGSSLYGLQGMSSKHSEIRSLLGAFHKKVQRNAESLDSQAVSNALYGMQRMSSDSAEVRAILLFIASKVPDCGSLESVGLSNAIYGLQGMSSCNSEVLAVVSALTPRVLKCSDHFNPQSVGNTLYGLQGMTSDSAEVRELLVALIPQISSCTESFNSRSISRALYGLQSMTSDCPVVRTLLSVLTPKIEASPESFGSRALGCALYGMQGMESDSPEVRALLSALLSKLQGTEEPMNIVDLSSAVYGMQGMREGPESQQLLECLLGQLKTALSRDQLKYLSHFDLSFATRQLVLSLDPVLKEQSCEWERISELLQGELAHRKKAGDHILPLKDVVTERRVYDAIKMTVAGSSVQVTRNEELFSLLECDTVIRIPVLGSAAPHTHPDTDTEHLVVNIEVDGVYHAWEKKRRYCRLRDQYLASKGVIVQRVDSTVLWKMTDEELESWSRASIARCLAESCEVQEDERAIALLQ
jgi:hypothetical protein